MKKDCVSVSFSRFHRETEERRVKSVETLDQMVELDQTKKVSRTWLRKDAKHAAFGGTADMFFCALGVLAPIKFLDVSFLFDTPQLAAG